jgi:hypothetical protein
MKSVSLGIALIAIVLLAALIVLPASGVVASTTTVTTTPPAATGIPATKLFISATVSTATLPVGNPVTISGLATGGNLSTGVQMWVFAGNYVNVTNVPVKADGTFSKTYLTTGLPPATYFVFVQSPGNDGIIDIDLVDAGMYSGQVFNTKTNAMIFNFTGVGNVQDAAASKALSDALNQPGQDDIYTKLTFQLTAPVDNPVAADTPATVPVTPAHPSSAPTTKSPLPFEVTTGALVISGCCAAFCMRKIH